MKRILSMILAFVMVLSLVPMTAFAADSPSITATADKTEAAIGDTIEVTFTLTNNPGFNNVDLLLNFDHNVLKFTGLKINEDTEAYEGRFGGGNTEINTIVGNEKYGTVLNARSTTTSTDGKLFVAQFTVIGAGNTAVGVTVNALQDVADDGSVTDHTGSVAVASSAEIAVAGIPATSVTLNKTELSLEEGKSYLLSATVEPTGTTDKVVWSSSDESVATVSNVGKIEAITAGEATITATAGSASATCMVTVEEEKNIITNGNTPSVMTGVKAITFGDEILTLRNIYKVTINGHEEATLNNSDSGASDGIGFIGYTLSKSVVWGTATYGSGVGSVALNSTNQYTATISTRDLLVSYNDLKAALGEADMAKLGVSENDELAFVVFDGPSYDYAVLIVVGAVPATGITLDESHIVLVGNEVTIGAEVAPSNHTDNIIWTSSDPTVASVDQNGKVTANKSGTVTITATVGECSDTCTVLVVDNSTEIAAPENDYRGRTVESVTVLGVGVDSYAWAKSSSTYTLTVYTSDENASAALIYKMNRYGTPYEDVIVHGSVENYEGQLSKEIIVDSYYSLGTWNVEFKKSVPATSLDLNKTSTEILVNKTETLVATLSEGSTDTATWTSSDESIATVDANGKVTAIAEGTVTITAKVRDMEKTCTVTVKAVHADSISISGEGIENGKLRIKKGSSVSLNSTTEPAEITDEIVWSTNKEDIVTMYTWNPGYIRATAPGTATITVTAGEGEHAKSASIEVEVYEVPAVSLTIDKTEATILTFEKLTLTATASPSDHTDGSITWTSSDTSVATVANGVVSPVKAGEATITAKVGNLEATCKVTVKEPEEGTVLYKDDGTFRNFWPANSPTAYINTLIMDGAKYETLANEGSVYTVTLPYTTAKDAEITLNAYAEGAQLSNLTLNWHEGDEAPTSWGDYENKFNHTFKLADGKATLIIRAFVTGRNSEGIKTFNFVIGEEPEPTTYTVTIDENITGGTVTASATENIEAGTEITLTAVPNEGYQFESFDVKMGEETVTVTDGKFVMPEGNVTVSATFKEIPAVEGYTVTMPADISIVTGETASIPVVVDNKDGSAYNAFDVSFTYDASKLELTSTVIDGMTVTYENGTVRVQRYGSDLSVGAAAFTLTFEAIGTGETTVTATEAKVGIAENAHELDAADATILDDATVITIGGYSVNLPDDFTGESTVAPGKDYTFEAKDKNYDYDVTAKIGDAEIPVTDNGDGTFTISADKITGNIVITSTKEGKTFEVSLGDDMTHTSGTVEVEGALMVQYMTEYKATLTKVDGYTYDLKVKIGGADYTGFTYDEATGVVTIPGADITGKVEFNSNKAEVQPSEYTVTFEGNGAGDATGETKVAAGTDYSFTLNKAEGYTYTVSYKMGDSTESVALTEADGKYTIAKVNGNLVITVEKESDLAVEVGAYVEMDGKTVFLVRATGTLAEGKAYAYNGDTMYYSNVYQAWSWLVIVEEGNTFTADDAKANITAVEAEYTTLDQTFNVNMTSKVDVNDAQLVYNIYNCEYNDFSVATMQKFLYADTNGDKIVDTLDAAAVVNNIP